MYLLFVSLLGAQSRNPSPQQKDTIRETTLGLGLSQVALVGGFVDWDEAHRSSRSIEGQRWEHRALAWDWVSWPAVFLSVQQLPVTAPLMCLLSRIPLATQPTKAAQDKLTPSTSTSTSTSSTQKTPRTKEIANSTPPLPPPPLPWFYHILQKSGS